MLRKRDFALKLCNYYVTKFISHSEIVSNYVTLDFIFYFANYHILYSYLNFVCRLLLILQIGSFFEKDTFFIFFIIKKTKL